MAAFVMIHWSVRRPLVTMGRDVHLMALIPIHFVRYVGLTVVLPGVFNLARRVSRRITSSKFDKGIVPSPTSSRRPANCSTAP